MSTHKIVTTKNVTKIVNASIIGPEGPSGFVVKITSLGLVLTTEEFSILDASGTAVQVATQSITAQASKTQFLVLDLFGLTLKLIDRQYHDGAVVLAEITTDAISTINISNLYTPIYPATKIHRFLKRLANSKNTGDVRIAVLGDSLMEPAGSGIKWSDLLFNATYSADGYNVPNLANITIDNYAVGGSTTHHGSILAGEGLYMASTGSHWGDTIIAYGASETSRRFSPPVADAGRSPLLADPYDLVIIGFGANGGALDLVLYENMVAELRKVGSEVVIVTQNYRTDNTVFLKDRGDTLDIMAQATGAALVDTWMYVLEDDRAGLTVHDDAVHMAAEGHKSWAKALSGVLNPALELMADKTPDISYVIGDGVSADGRNWDMHPNYCMTQFTPYATDGTVAQATTVTAVNKNPAVILGGKTTSNAVTSVATGQYAAFGHMWANAFDVIVDGSNVFTADIKVQNKASTIGSISLGTANSGEAVVIEGGAATAFADLSSNFRSNKSIQIVVTSGTMKILGVVFRCDKITELDIDTDVKTKGTFTSEAWAYAHPNSVYSDIDGDSISFDYVGSDAVIYLSSRSAAGIVDIYLDGKIIYNQLDLYSGGTFVKSVHIPATPDFDYRKNRPAKHSVQVRLNGSNVSVGAPAGQNRRLGVLGVHVFDKG